MKINHVKFLSQSILRNAFTLCSIVYCSSTLAVAYTFPGTAIAPQTLANSDTLIVTSGLFQTTNSSNYTVNSLGDSIVDVQAGATISYAGTNPTGATIYSSRSNSATQNYNIYGTLEAGTSNYAFYSNNSAANSDTIITTLYDGSVVNGNYFSSGSAISLLTSAGNVTINGSINLLSNNNEFRVGYAGSTVPFSNAVLNGSLSSIQLWVMDDSSLTLNGPATGRAAQLRPRATLYFNNTIAYPYIIGGTDSALYINGNIDQASSTLVANSLFGMGNMYVAKAVTWTMKPNGGCEIDGIVDFTLNSMSDYGSLTVSGSDPGSPTSINQFSAHYTGGYFANGTYTLYSNPTEFTSTPTVASSPTSTAYLTFGEIQIGTNTVTITVSSAPMQNYATNMVNYEIAGALISHTPQNAAQTTLYNALIQSENQTMYNDNLHQLMPNINASAANFSLQNSVIHVIEKRSASFAYNEDEMFGIASGELYYNTATWLGGFGNIGKQRANGENDGYKIKGGGVLLGLDYCNYVGDVYGVAFGLTSARIDELSNSGFENNIFGYNALIYGVNSFDGNMFCEWIISGVINNQTGNRPINISTNNFSTNYNYRSWLVSPKINVGKFVDVGEYIRLSQVNSLQYAYMYQPTYTESGSVAALQVSPQENQNLLTVGTGARISIPGDLTWDFGSNELRAMVTYDVIIPDRSITTNFVFGGSTFEIINPEERLAFHLGGDFGFTFCRDHLQLQLRADYEIRSHYNDFAASVALRYLF